MQLTENALTTLRERYLLRDESGTIAEEPSGLFDRVAAAIAAIEKPEDRSYWKGVFERLMTSTDFMPNTPTLMNAGKKNGQLSACYVLPIEDSMVGIFTTLKDAAIVHQTGGGTGFDFSRLRPKGSMVSNKSGVSTGPLSFAEVYNKATDAVKQGASRRGANMMNLRVDHPDILEFIDMKLDVGIKHLPESVASAMEAAGIDPDAALEKLSKGRMVNFNVSVTITDEFMEALKEDGTYELKHPFTGTVGELRAKEVWDRIANNAWKSAEPGIIFIDRVNAKSPYWESIEATNPCGEQPLPPYGSCNLGSINLANFVRGAKFDWIRLGQVVEESTRFLDNVIDANVYPTPELDAHAKHYRNIGLGVMGWADALLRLGIPYNTKEAVALAESVQEFINEVAHRYSIELAREKGLPSGAPFKTFFDYSSSERRNATLTTVAPTGSISRIAGCSSGIEPVFAWEYESHIMDQVLIDRHAIYAEAKEYGWYDEDLFVESHRVSVPFHVDMQAAFQKHCDSAISKTINLPTEATVEDVQDAYIRAWETGCKGITVYRDGSREGVLHKIEQSEDDSVSDEIIAELCCDSPNIVNEGGCETCYSCGVSKCLIA